MYRVLHCFYQYLNVSENWAYRIIKNIPDTETYILSPVYLNNDFYNYSFKYLGYKNSWIWLTRRAVFFIRKIIKNNFLLKVVNNISSKVINFFIKHKVEKEKIQIIHAHFSFVGWEYMKLSKKLNIPLIVSFYGMDYEHLPHINPIWVERYKLLFENCSKVVCEGNFGAKTLEKIGCPKEKIVVSYLGVESENISYYNRKKEKGELKLLQIANFNEKKGHVDTINAFIIALRTCPNMTLTFVGKNATDVDIFGQIKEITMSNNISDKVFFYEKIDFSKLHLFMKDFDVFIHPSCHSSLMDCEGGAPIVLLDAQATGMPIISTTHCDIPDEVLHNETGILSPEKDNIALSESIIKFYEMDNLTYQQFSINARVHIEEFYDAKKNAEKLKNIYSSIILK